MDDYRLPAVYGKSRLVLLAVNPYLIHAYWEIAREDLGKAKELAADAQEVLRFYKRSELASEDAPSDCFDVEIDLSPISRPADSAEIVAEKIEPVYAFHHWPSDPSEPDTARAAKTFNVSTGSPNIDLTAMAERNLAAGSSSVSLQKGRPDSAPD